MKIAFITNFCPHYRIKTFETLAKYHDVKYYFFSEGKEWYWRQEYGVYIGQFKYEYLKGFSVAKTQITPYLPLALFNGKYDVYIKCINGRFALPATFLISRLRRKPFILWTGIWIRLQTKAHRLIFPLTRWIYRQSDAIVVYGEHVKKYLMEEGVPSERIFVAAHAVDNEFYSKEVSEIEKSALRDLLKIQNHQKVILYLGRLEESKGLSVLLNAYKKIASPNIILVIAGDGSIKSEIECQATDIGINDEVRFPGFVSREDSVIYYSISNVFVLPSVTTPAGKEPWGLVVNEAFNQGVPVVASEAVGAAAGGLVKDGINGFIIREQDDEQLAEALLKILLNEDLKRQMSINAKRTVESWNNEKMVSGFIEAINFVMQCK